MPKNISDFRTEADLVAYAQANPDLRVTCTCGNPEHCGTEAEVPAWVYNPEITGYPHERRSQ